MIKNYKFYILIKNIYFLFLDQIVFFFKVNKKHGEFKTKNFVIWVAETGSRDFLPRFAQAISLWEEYSIPSLIIHKHYLKKIGKKILKKSVVIDKSATFSCMQRLRYAKLNGSLNIIIPEELLICDLVQEQIQGILNRKTLNYVDLIANNSIEVKKYLKNLNMVDSTINTINPRLCIDQIKKISNTLFEKNKLSKNLLDEEFLLINDKLSLKFSSLDEELNILRYKVFKSTDINSEEYIENYLNQEEKDEDLLIELINKIRDCSFFNKYKIVIRPHPSVDLRKYKSYFESKLNPNLNFLIIRDGTAIDWMSEAKVTFHNNCTTAVEGHFGGFNNILNYADKVRSGTSEKFKLILKPLGIRKSIIYAKDIIELKKIKSKDNLNFKYKKNFLHTFLGTRMQIIENKHDHYPIVEKFKDSEIKELSPLDRWRDAEEKINYIRKNKKKFSKLLVRPLGKIGVQIGKGIC